MQAAQGQLGVAWDGYTYIQAYHTLYGGTSGLQTPSVERSEAPQAPAHAVEHTLHSDERSCNTVLHPCTQQRSSVGCVAPGPRLCVDEDPPATWGVEVLVLLLFGGLPAISTGESRYLRAIELTVRHALEGYLSGGLNTADIG